MRGGEGQEKRESSRLNFKHNNGHVVMPTDTEVIKL